MCYISVSNLAGGGDSDDDDDMAFSSSSASGGSGGNGFQKIAVRRNHETGEITGWQEFYNMARMDNPNLQSEEQKHQNLFN